jgi:hypothetical protein
MEYGSAPLSSPAASWAHCAGSAVNGTHHLRQAVIDRVQLMELAVALAAELDITFGEDFPGRQ